MRTAARGTRAARATILAGAAAWLVLAAGACGQDVAGGAKYVPAADLAAYAEFDGLDAHADAWKKSATYRLLNETTAGVMLEELIGQLADKAPAGAGRPVSGAEAVAIAKHVLRHGFTFGVNGPFTGPNAKGAFGTLVLRGAAGPGARGLFDRVIRGRIPRGVASRTERLDGREVLVVRPDEPGGSWAFWSEGTDVVVTFAGGLNAPRAVIAALKGDAPNASTHPLRAELAKADAGFEPVGLAFADAAALPELPPPAVQLGLDGIKRLEHRFGFQGEALRSVTRLAAPAPRRGLLTILDQPTFGAKSLPPLPADLRDFTVLSIDWGKVFDAIAQIPDGEQAITRISDAFRGQTGLRLREDLLDAVGPRWAFYVAPQTMQVPSNPLLGLADWMFHLPRLTAVVEIRKTGEFGRNAGELMTAINDLLKQAPFPAVARGQATPPEFRKLEDGKGYVLSIPPEILPTPSGFRPTLLIGEQYAALGISPEAAGDALEAKADDALEAMLRERGDDLVFLQLSDPRRMTPELIANLPFLLQLLARSGDGPNRPAGMQALASIKVDPELIPSTDAMRAFLFPSITTASIDDQGLTIDSRQAFPSINPMSTSPVAIALLLPAVQASREAARRAQCTNNLKQIALAMHNYHSANNKFPAHAIYSEGGKPLLSWRVAILPFIEQQALYNEFHLDEPWDSEHNKKLIEQMPATYACPSGKHEPGTTPYQVAVGKGTMFEEPEGHGIAEVTDGTSNTIMVAEAPKTVIWTKPDDLALTDEALPRIGSNHPGGANVAFGDGSVRFIKQTIDQAVLRALFTRNGGEVISADQF
jgi:prepilin-type processing-associated H-X9-DG protein